MEQLINKIQKASKEKNGKEVANSTLNKYFSHINTYLKTKYNIVEEKDLQKYYIKLDWLNDHNSIINYFNNFKNNNTKKTHLVTIKTILGLKYPQTEDDIKLEKILSDMIKDCKNENNIQKQEGGKSEKIISLSNFNKFVDILSKNYKTQQEALMYKILWHIPMRNEIGSLEIIKGSNFKKLSEDKKKDKNYLIISNKDIKIYRDEYKTSKIYGSKTITIEDPKLVTSIRDYIKQEGIKEGQYLFVEHDKRFMKDFRKELGNNNVSNYLYNISRKYLDGSLAETNIVKSVIRHNFDLIGDDVKKKREFLKTIHIKRGTTMEVLIKDYLANKFTVKYIEFKKK